MTDEEIIRCVECDITMVSEKWEKHKESMLHTLNTRVNYVKATMDAVGLSLKDLSRVLRRREKTDSKAGQLTLSLGVKQKTSMKA